MLDVPLEGDKVIEVEGLRVHVDPFSFYYVENLQVDWVETRYGADFHFHIN